ncbi:hypothetical protein HJ170_22635 [Vibrio parahaemolyticus]|nr:hypothetical protein [Vibrio parahaemolyticus]
MKTVFVEYSSSSFSDLHDKKWVENLCHLVQDTEFDDILDDFLAQWWGDCPHVCFTGTNDIIARKHVKL